MLPSTRSPCPPVQAGLSVQIIGRAPISMATLATCQHGTPSLQVEQTHLKHPSASALTQYFVCDGDARGSGPSSHAPMRFLKTRGAPARPLARARSIALLHLPAEYKTRGRAKL